MCCDWIKKPLGAVASCVGGVWVEGEKRKLASIHEKCWISRLTGNDDQFRLEVRERRGGRLEEAVSEKDGDSRHMMWQ